MHTVYDRSYIIFLNLSIIFLLLYCFMFYYFTFTFILFNFLFYNLLEVERVIYDVNPRWL